MEILDICDELGNPTGKTVEREIAHQQGILHRTAHVWILRKKENKIQILLQKRSEQIFVLWKDLEEKDFVFVDHEVSEVKWLDFEKCYQDVKENKINHCIYIEELDIVKKYLRVQ